MPGKVNRFLAGREPFTVAAVQASPAFLDPLYAELLANSVTIPSGESPVWAQGDGSTLGTYDTHLGRIGGLICWENYMSLARYAMHA